MKLSFFIEQDLILNAWALTIASQVVLSLPFVPCLPYLELFLESLDSGILGNVFSEESRGTGYQQLDLKQMQQEIH